MSTIQVSNIRIASESVSRPVRNVAASWVHFYGKETPYIVASSNVSSLTDNSAGRHGINLTSGMSSSKDYSITTTKQDTTVNTDSTSFDAVSNRSAGSYEVISIEAGVASDSNNTNAVQMGDLA